MLYVSPHSHWCTFILFQLLQMNKRESCALLFLLSVKLRKIFREYLWTCNIWVIMPSDYVSPSWELFDLLFWIFIVLYYYSCENKNTDHAHCHYYRIMVHLLTMELHCNDLIQYCALYTMQPMVLSGRACSLNRVNYLYITIFFVYSLFRYNLF